MKVTRDSVAKQLGDYLHGTLSLGELVDWAESAMCNGEFDEAQITVLSDIVARIGVADVRAFGLTWEECRDMLSSLGLSAKVDLVAA
jgi:hypothetical protein